MCVWPSAECDDGNCVDWDGCTWGTISEFRVDLGGASSNPWNPQVARLPEGGFVVAWTVGVPEAEASGVMARLYLGSGEEDGEPFMLNPLAPGIDSWLRHVVSLPSGGGLATWNTSIEYGGPKLLFGQRLSADGTKLGEPVVLGQVPAGGGDCALAASSAGGLVLVWSRSGFGGFDGIEASLLDAAAFDLVLSFQVHQHYSGDKVSPQVASTKGGGFIVVWNSEGGQDGSKDGIFARFFSATGLPEGDEFQVNLKTEGAQGAPRVAVLSDGSVVVVFTDFAMSDQPAMGRLYGPDHLALGGEVKLAKYGHGKSLAALDGGGFALAFCSSPPKVLIFDGAVGQVGEVVEVAVMETDIWEGARLVGLDSGGVVAVWRVVFSEGQASGIFAQRFDAQGMKLVH